MIIVYLAQCCLFFWKKTSLRPFKFFRKKSNQNIVSIKPLQIKQNEYSYLIQTIMHIRQTYLDESIIIF